MSKQQDSSQLKDAGQKLKAALNEFEAILTEKKDEETRFEKARREKLMGEIKKLVENLS